jgi:hypothetical protein
MAEVLNSELNQYWAHLNAEERESILSVMRSFLRLKVSKKENETDNEYTDEFKSILHERRADYKAGGKTFTLEESLERIDKILSA